MPIYGLKLLTEEGTSLSWQYPPVTYPVNEWVNVPGNGAYVAITDKLLSVRSGELLVQMECEEPTGAYALYGIVCYRWVRRLAEIDMEWVTTLSDALRTAVAEHGPDGRRDALVNDSGWQVRRAVAWCGNNGHRDILLHDPEWLVREQVAFYGTNTHRDALLHDPDWRVRKAVALVGTDEHRAILEHDPDELVRGAAQSPWVLTGRACA